MQFPPLAISDLVVLTLSLAFAMACAAPGVQHILSESHNLSRLGNWREASRELTDYTAFGLSLFGLIVLGRQRIRGSSWQLQPGHWLLLAAGPYSIALVFVIAFQHYEPQGPRELWPDVILIVILEASAMISIFGVRTSDWAWRACVTAVIAWLQSSTAFCVWEVGRSAGFWRSPISFRLTLYAGTSALGIAGAAAVTAMVTDVRRGLRRDWLHFCGVATLACHVASYLTSFGPMTARWWRDLFLHILP